MSRDERTTLAPQPAIVPCVWDNEAKCYVSAYSHRGVEITGSVSSRAVSSQAAAPEVE